MDSEDRDDENTMEYCPDQLEIDKQQRFREQRRAAFAEKFLTVLLSVLAVGVVLFLVWSFFIDK